MKKSHYILIAACVILLGFGLVKLYQRNNLVASSPIEQMLMESAARIKQVLAMCEMDDDEAAFIQKAYDLGEGHREWHYKNREFFIKNPQLAQKIDEQWMDAIYQLGLSLRNESSQLRREKKSATMQIIASELTKDNRDTIEGYIKNRMQQDGIAMAVPVQ